MELQKRNAGRFMKLVFSAVMLGVLFCGMSLEAADKSNAILYEHLSDLAKNGNKGVIQQLNQDSRQLDWQAGERLEFTGHLRFLSDSQVSDNPDQTQLYLVRRTDGEIYILSIPDRNNPIYSGLSKMLENKLEFKIRTQSMSIDGKQYQLAQFIDLPVQPFFDKIFRLMIILMLFLVMIGMGLTLTGKDFAILFSNPRGILIGEVLQFGVMPLIAVGLGYLMGFNTSYPYIFVGMVLITVTPGGVTSNLMTHYGKGDVALSVALTSISTVLSIVFLPLLLSAYCANIPDIQVPVKLIILTIIVLVIAPLTIGMFVRRLNEKLAVKLTPIFSAFGIVALLFLIIAGVLSNLEAFADTERHNVLFYTMILSLTFAGMFVGGVVPKLFGVSNFQTRAISLETGLRNSALAMTIAILIQDAMGDFYSSMFIVSGIFGLVMYLAGLVSIKLYPRFFPVED
jgi:BASS family bile acid:Na+ symporter